MAPDLCALCHAFDLHSFERDCLGYRGYSLGRVTEGVAQGCPFCTLLKDGLEHFSKFPVFSTSQRYVHFSLQRANATVNDSVDTNGATGGLMVIGLKVGLSFRTFPFQGEVVLEPENLCLNVTADPGTLAIVP